MKKRRRLLLAAMCLACSFGLNAYAVRSALEHQESRRVAALEKFGGEVVELVVASHELKPGEHLSSANTQKKSFIADLVPEGAYTSLDLIRDQPLSSAVPAGAPICELHVRPDDKTLDVPDGRVALAFSFSDKLSLPLTADKGASLAAYSVSEGSTQLLAPELILLSDVPTKGMQGSITVAVLPSEVSSLLSAHAKGLLRLVVPSSTTQLDLVTQSQLATPAVAVSKSQQSE